MTDILMSDGRMWDLAEPKVRCGSALINGCSRINRFNGATNKSWSVLQHMLLCEQIARSIGSSLDVQRTVLIHDLHEAVVGDVSSPVKAHLGGIFRELDKSWLHAVYKFYLGGVPDEDILIKVAKIDAYALALERQELLPFNARWRPYFPANIEYLASDIKERLPAVVVMDYKKQLKAHDLT